MAIGWLNKFFHIHELLNLGLCLYHFLVCKIFNAISISIFDCVCLNPCSMSNYPKIDKEVVCLFKICTHRGFLEHWNSQKSVCNIWQRFSCLLDEGVPKIWKKLNSHNGFLSYLQNSTANSAHLAAHFCTALVCPQKSTVRIQFLPDFWNLLIK